MKLYNTSYKHFNSGFFKVASAEEFPFFLEASGHLRYHLFWEHEQTIFSKIDYESLGLEGQVLVDLLTFFLRLKMAKFVEFNDDPEKLA